MDNKVANRMAWAVMERTEEVLEILADIKAHLTDMDCCGDSLTIVQGVSDMLEDVATDMAGRISATVIEGMDW